MAPAGIQNAALGQGIDPSATYTRPAKLITQILFFGMPLRTTEMCLSVLEHPMKIKSSYFLILLIRKVIIKVGFLFLLMESIFPYGCYVFKSIK
jgi:hypothetical protein